MLEPKVCRSDRPLAIALHLRNQAVNELFYACALRPEELMVLSMASVNLEERRIKVRGKGDKDRFVPIPLAAREAMRSYLSDDGRKLLAEQLRPRETKNSRNHAETVFLSSHGRQLTGAPIREIVKSANHEATPRRLRRSRADHMVARGANIEDVQLLLGHASIETTKANYTDFPPEILREAHRKYHPRAACSSSADIGLAATTEQPADPGKAFDQRSEPKEKQ